MMENDGKMIEKPRSVGKFIENGRYIDSVQCFVSRTYSLNLKHWVEGFFSIFQKFEELFNLIDYFLI